MPKPKKMGKLKTKIPMYQIFSIYVILNFNTTSPLMKGDVLTAINGLLILQKNTATVPRLHLTGRSSLFMG